MPVGTPEIHVVVDVFTAQLLADGTVVVLDDAPISFICAEGGALRVVATGDFVVAGGKLGVRVRGTPRA